MANILDYLAWRGDLTLAQDPFNEVDNLILSELCFFDFDSVMSEGEIINLGTLARLFFERNPKETYRLGLLFSSAFSELLSSAAESHRFGNILVSHPVNRVEKDPAMQFSATTFSLEDGTHYVAFRGTDDHLVAWKESFSLGIQDDIPSHHAALAYLKQALAAVKGPVRVGGHSKGGNLALYAALHLSDEERQRILAVYCNDGPGFRKNVRKSQAYQAIAPRLFSITPYLSLVGAVLEHGDDSEIVESDGKGVFQHDGFTWHVAGNRFVRLPDRSEASRKFEDTLKSWLDKLDDEEKRVFLETVYKLLTASGAETLSDLNDDRLRASYKFAASILTLEKNTRELVTRSLALLFRERKRVLRERKEMSKKQTVSAPQEKLLTPGEITAKLDEELATDILPELTVDASPVGDVPAEAEKPKRKRFPKNEKKNKK